MALDDFFGTGWDDPRSGQILGLAQGLLSAPGGRGLAAGIGYMNQAQQDALKAKYIKAQIDEQSAQANERTQKTASAKALAEQQQRIRDAIPGLYESQAAGGALPPSTPSGLPTLPQGAGMAPAQQAGPGALNWQKAMQLGIPLEDIKKMAELPNLGRAEVARTIKGMGANGVEQETQYDKYGQPIGKSVDQYRAPIQVDRGDRKDFLDAYSLQPKASLPILQSPDSKASNALGWANNATTRRGQDMTDARSRETTALGGQQFDAASGNIINTRTGEARPVMLNGAPLGPKEKGLTDVQAKALQFSSRMENSHDIMSKLAEKGATNVIPGTDAGYGVGAAIRALGPKENQQLEQAQRDFVNAILRRESGAAIGKGEFDSAKQQYFPQIGDSAETIAQKKANREISIAGLKAEIPKGAPKIEDFMPNGKSSSMSGGGWSATKVK